MADTRKYAQLQAFTLAGAGSSISDIDLTLQSFNDIDGNPLTLADFGTKGYGTLEPGSLQQEEQISFISITNNSNGTVTLGGVSHVDFLAPYTETSGMQKSHAGGVTFVISNTSGFYNTFANKKDDETIEETWTFTNPNVPRMDTEPAYGAGTELYFATKEYVDASVSAGAPDASTTTKGLVQEATQAQVDARTAVGSTGARLFLDPVTLRATQYHDYEADAGSTDAYAITVTPSIAAYVDGDVFIFRANTANTGAASLTVNSVGPKSVVKYGNKALDNNDILANQIVTVIFNSTLDVFELQNPPSKQQVSQDGGEVYGASLVGTDSYAITLVPAITAYTTGLSLRFKVDVANTGASTLSVNGLAATPLKKQVSVDMATGDILAGQIIEAVFDGTNFQVVSGIASTFAFDSGLTTELVTTTAGNNDLTITTGFTPRVIRLSYTLQGHDAATEGAKFLGVKGIALYQGTTLKNNMIFWGIQASAPLSGGSALTGDDGTPDSLTYLVQEINSNAPTAGTPTNTGGAIRIILTVNAVSSTGFTVRRVTFLGGAGGNNARCKLAYEAWG